jgi:hypothetical protein
MVGLLIAGLRRGRVVMIRAWARPHGYEVGERGRVAADIVDAYHLSVG